MWHKVAFIIVLISLTDAFECGVRKNNVNKVIVRGQQTSPGDWPWHVAIYHQGYSSYSYACGGTLLSKIFVLTADHCVRSENDYVISSRNIFVRLGLHNMRELNRQTFQQHKVQQIHTLGLSKQLKNDIAILELATEAEFTNFVQPACVNQVKDLTNQFGTAVGWGVDETDRISQVLKSQRMPVVSTNKCLESNRGIFRQVLDSSLFCAGFTNGTTVCNGDSGGGLHFERNGTWYVGGIVSFTAPRGSSNRCNLKSYAGFTDVQRFLPWIFNVTDLHRLEENAENVEIVKPDLYENHLPEDCGRYLVNRIYGGTQAALYEFPWMARLVIRSDSTEHVQPICLPVTPSLRRQRPQQGIVAGWGALKVNQSYPMVLQKTTVRVLDQADCEDIIPLKFHVGENTLCSGGNATPNTCNWDDGAPLGYPSLYNERVRFVQFGIASVFGCEINPSIYTNVASYMDWILANLKP
ncbi:proacrosin [Culex quinquefasciatus]|uniref:Proacrosin n=1 Tax=Culex quinquefasciatus TaxID=7176 RepID=B0WX30_CULQU|nr:proacrosin [Culex quinquefasciatus]|eukprot:XP_001861952.1 proacrosin [Culex quinquefasciatus]